MPAYRPTIAELRPNDYIIRAVQDPVRNRPYVLTNRNVAVVDTDIVSIVATIPVNFGGYDLSISPDNNRLWVSDGTGIHSYSLTDFSLLPEIPNCPFYFQQVREGLGGKLYVTDPSSNPGTELTLGLYELDIATGKVTPIRVAMPGYSIDARIDTSPDGRNLYASFVDGPADMTRYDISSGTPVLLTDFAPASVSDFIELSVSPDGKLVSYKAQDEFVAKETIFTIANTLKGPTTVIDPAVELGSLNFSSGMAYVNRGISTGYQHSQLDFNNTVSGYPFNSWTVADFGPAFTDHQGTNLYLMGYSTIYVYSLAPDGSPGVEPAPKSLLNVSTRSVVGVDDNRMIGGFIITGDAAKEIAFRALGPTLPVVGAMTDPAISVYDSTGALVATNKNWNQYRDQIVSAGLAPFDEHEAALITTLAPGSYTAVVSFESGGTGGIGLVELYDLSSDNSGKIANLSTRSKVGTGDNVLIGGFIVGGTEVTNVIARAIGPTLAGSVTGVLLDPVLELHDINGAEIASNDDWRSNQESEIVASGLPPADNRESAILISLQPGPHTAIVRGKDDSTGIALVEIYNLDSTAPAQKAASR